MTRSCIVVGGGISGMSAALLLSRNDYHVTLIEKAPRLAPLVRGFKRKGMHFDTGFHHTGYLGPGEVLDRAFKLMGLAGLKPFALGAKGDQRVLIDGEPELGYPMPSGFQRVLTELGDLFPKERDALRRYLQAVETTQENSAYLALDTLADAHSQTTSPFPNTSLAEVLNELFVDARLKSVLASQTLYHGVPPSEVSFLFHARVGAAGLRSLHTLKGGGEALVQAFEKALERAGVRVVTGLGVQGFEVSAAGSLCGARLEDDSVIQAETCVCTIHPALLANLVPSGVFRPAYVKRLAGLPESPSASMLFGLLEENCQAKPGDSWFILNGNDPERWFTHTENGRPNSMSLMISPSSQTQSRLGFELAISGQIIRSGQDDEQSIREHFQRRMPKLAQQAEYLDFASPATFARYTNSPYGSCYGPKHAFGTHGPQPRTRLPGLYLAGQAVVAPGIAGAVISACVTVDVLLGSDITLGELRQC